MKSSIKIISGGQSGVDRAALSFALNHQFETGGYCPKGRLAEDGPINKRFPLTETTSIDYDVRTKMNASNSDATLLLYDQELDKGSTYTKEVCQELNKPLLCINISEINHSDFKQWIIDHKVKVLNIAGPRESKSPGIFNKTWDLLPILFSCH